MSWAIHAIEDLTTRGRPTCIRPRGNSMAPYIRSGNRVWLDPVTSDTKLQKDDIVLARVKGNVYLHFVKAIDGERVQIGNASGHINGWTRMVYGKVTAIER